TRFSRDWSSDVCSSDLNILDLTAASAPADGNYLIATTTGGATYTAGTVNLTGVAGTVSVIGTDLVLTVGSGGGYGSWASTNVGGDDEDVDTNGDGVPNGIAYFMNNAGVITLPGIVGNSITWTNGGNIPA